jgi:predicted amidohydrolase YtcJ
VTSEESLSRIAALGVVPVPQGRFVGEIGDGMRAALGPTRTSYAYRLRSFSAAGAILAASSDRPVVTGRPLLGIRDMVMRRTESGQPFGAEEAISAEDALRAYSFGSAFAEHAEAGRGALRLGQLADYVVLSEDPRRVAPQDISGIEVLATSRPADDPSCATM